MAADHIDTPRLRELLAGLTEGLLTEAEEEELTGLLNADDAARAFYRNYIAMEALLWWEYTLPTEPPAREASPPALGFLGTAVQGTTGYFSSAWPVAYLVATVILGLGLIIGSLVPTSHPQRHIAVPSVPSPSSPSALQSSSPFVGRITGMVDCQWSDPHAAVPGPVAVPLGRKYALSSGLLEITYHTGAKVILQGPCTYEVESAASGFLSLGKLTARVESAKQQPANPQSLIPDLSLPTTHHPLFTITTPTATVTDLGTEFGVEVRENGQTTSHVFRGSVEIRTVSSREESTTAAKVLHENESIVVALTEGTPDGSDRAAVLVPSGAKIAFVRELPKTSLKSLDLVDVVAGGDGFSGRRGRGIDPTTGHVVESPTKDLLHGDGQYHGVEGMPFVDGVFIPDDRDGPVQVDSAGHRFAGFLTSEDVAGEYIWAGGPIPIHPAHGGLHVRTKLGNIDYALPGHGLIFLHANKGITFDLEAIRRANPVSKLVRFRAVTGDTENGNFENGLSVFADVWVLVDGKVRFQRRQINGNCGALPVMIPLHDNDRFLTLVATDAGNGIAADWILFGDPRLELLSVTTAVEKGGVSTKK